jgi:sugar O-acyltransferase (sialic acid O-acetyltransferase NeuD family)
MKKKILLYGGMSTAFIVQEMLKDDNIKTDYIFDEYIKKPHFQTKAKFFNDKKDLIKLIKNSTHFFVCIGMFGGILRVNISEQLIKFGLKTFSIFSKKAIIDKSAKVGQGCLIMPGAVVHKKVFVGNDCYINVNAVVDHESILGKGVHVMGSAYIAGKVLIDDYASIGANATILPYCRIGKGAVVGAGSVVTKDVKAYETVVGNPAKFLKKNEIKYNYEIF